MKIVIISIFLGLSLFSCKKEDKDTVCFNPDIIHNGVCTADCPGFIGCDGKTYCNSCEAARFGIGPK
jgi:hypothetical protein